MAIMISCSVSMASRLSFGLNRSANVADRRRITV